MDSSLRHCLKHRPIWIPNAGPQAEALFSPAREIWYGGAAGGGKTALAIGLALTAHQRTLIFRQTYGQHRAIIDELERLTGQAFNHQHKTLLTPDGRHIELGAMRYEKDREKYQGRPFDLTVYDEVTHFSRTQFMFTKAWNRTADPRQPCRILCTFNPPTDRRAQWVLDYLAPWLEPDHPVAAACGETRYYFIDGHEQHWQATDIPRQIEDRWIHPTPCTFIRAQVEDNPFYLRTGYDQHLESLPEPLRSQLRYGDFRAGLQDDRWQLIPTAWIEAAMDRYRHLDSASERLLTVGVDVARGGPDRTVFALRYADRLELQVHPGRDTPDADSVCNRLEQLSPGVEAVFCVDVIGVGASVVDQLRNRLGAGRVQAVHVGRKSHARTVQGAYGFLNLRAELGWRLREALEAGQLALPPDRALLEELTAMRWVLRPDNRVSMASKDQIRERLGRSPDLADALLLSLAGRGGSGPLIWVHQA